MLDLRPSCENCDRDLDPSAPGAFICSFECTFCAPCAETILRFCCPNCTGTLAARPARPTHALASYPASTERVTRARPLPAFDIRVDDLTHPETRALLAAHLAGMHANSPAGHVFALDLSGLQTPDITVWSLWRNESIAAIGALKQLDQAHAELKSMRTHPDHLRTGAATILLLHMISQARARGMSKLSLETGSGAAFDPALALYRKYGFEDGEAFGNYRRSGFNQFLHLNL